MIFAETSRLILRTPARSDFEAYLRSWDDPEMTRYTAPRRGDIAEFIRGLIDEMQHKRPGDLEPQPWYQVTIARRDSGAVIGDLGLGFELPGERQVELGYRIHPDHQRQGYAREAVAAIIDYLIDEHDTHRFVGVVAAPHAASINVLRALGFRREGCFKQSFWCRGQWLDDEYYALLASEWRGKR
jgi:RimJ/RimL family protein N-acetyltransferase